MKLQKLTSSNLVVISKREFSGWVPFTIVSLLTLLVSTLFVLWNRSSRFLYILGCHLNHQSIISFSSSIHFLEFLEILLFHLKYYHLLLQISGQSSRQLCHRSAWAHLGPDDLPPSSRRRLPRLLHEEPRRLVETLGRVGGGQGVP